MKQLIINIQKIFVTKAPGHQGFIFIKTLCVTLCLCVLVANFVSGKANHDNELSPGDEEIKKTSVSSMTSVAKSNYMEESIEGISIDQIIEWVKRNPWIIQLVTENPDNQRLKEELVKYFESHAVWEKEKEQKLQELTEIGNTERHLQSKIQEIAQLKSQIPGIDTDTIDGLKLLLQKKTEIILELESALQISQTISQSNHLFYAKEFELRYIANGILKDADDNIGNNNLLVIGLGGYYDPWKKTYGAGIFVGIDIQSLLKRFF